MSAFLQMVECWHRIAMATRFFGGKALLSMEIDALAAWTPECWMRNLDNGEGSIVVESQQQRRPPKGGRCRVNSLSHRFSG
jgi:hypothetical protein